MEDIKDLPFLEDFDLPTLIKSLNKIQEYIVEKANLQSFESENAILQDILEVVNSCQYKMDNEKWDRVRFFLLAFVNVHIPNSDIIPVVSLSTDFGPLHSMLISLCILKMHNLHFTSKYKGSVTFENENQIQAEIINEQFSKVLDTILNEQKSPNLFYTRSCATYSYYLPHLYSSYSSYSKQYCQFHGENVNFSNNQELFILIFNDIKNNIDNGNFSYVQFNCYTQYFFVEQILQEYLKNKKYSSFVCYIMINSLVFNLNASNPLLRIYFKLFYFTLIKDKISYSTNSDQIIESISIFFNKINNTLADDFYVNVKISYLYEIFLESASFSQLRVPLLKFFCKFLLIKNQNDVKMDVYYKHFIDYLYKQYEQLKHKSMDAYSKAMKQSQEFNEDLSAQIQNNDLNSLVYTLSKNNDKKMWPLFYLFEQIGLSLNYLKGILKKIKIPHNQNSNTEYIYFYQQYQNKEQNPIDKMLYTRIEYDSKIPPQDFFQLSLQCIYSASSYSIIPLSFFQKSFEKLFEAIIFGHENFKKIKQLSSKKNIPSFLNNFICEDSDLLFYFNHLFIIIFNLFIEISYRYTLLSSFHENMDYYYHINEFNKTYFQEKTKKDSLLKSICKAIGNIFKINHKQRDFIDLILAQIMADLIFRAIKKRRITYLFVTNFYNIVPNSVSLYVLKFLFYRSIDKTKYVDSIDTETCNNFHQLILIILRLGEYPNLYPNNDFSMILRNYQKVILTLLFSRIKISHNREFLLTMIQYNSIMKDYADENLREEFKKIKNRDHFKINIQKHYDYRNDLKTLATNLFLDLTLFDYPQNEIITSLVPYFANAFKSKKCGLIHEALSLTLPFLISQNQESALSNEQTIFDSNNDFFRPFYVSLFKSIPFCSDDDAFNILESIPSLIRLFHPWKTTIQSLENKFNLPHFEIDLNKILKSINSNFTGRKNESIHIYLFISGLFDFFEKNDFYFNQLSLDTLELIIQLLINLFGYSFITQKVVSLFKRIHHFFIPEVENGNYNYLFSLFLCVPNAYSEVNSLYVNVINVFVTEIELSKENGTKFINEFFTMIKLPFNINSILVALSMIAKVCPGSILHSHIFTFLEILSNCHKSYPNAFPSLYNKPFSAFLKAFIQSLPKSEYSKTVNTFLFFLTSKTLNLNIKKSLIMRLYELDAVSPFANYDHLRNPMSKDIFYCLFAATLAIGIQDENISVPIDLIKKSYLEIKQSENPNSDLNLSEFTIRVVFLKIVVYTQPLSSPFFEEACLFQIFNFLVDAINLYYFKNKIKKIFDKYKEKVPSLYQNYISSIEHSIQSKSLQEKLKISIHYATPCPQLFKSELIKLVFQKVLQIIELPAEKRFDIFNTITFNIYILTHLDYSIPETRNFFLSELENGMSYFNIFIQFVFTMIQDKSFPGLYSFYDSFLHFINQFKSETVYYILHNNNLDIIETGYIILYKLIKDDKSDSYINELISQIQNLSFSINSYDSVDRFLFSPYLLNLLYKLSKKQKFLLFKSFSDLIIQFLSQIISRVEETKDYRPCQNESIQEVFIFKMALNIIKKMNAPDSDIQDQNLFIIFELAKFFNYPNFIRSPLYFKFNKIIFQRNDRNFSLRLFNLILTSFDNHTFDKTINYQLILICQALKILKQLTPDEDFLFCKAMSILISFSECISLVYKCFHIYFKFNSPTKNNTSLIFSTFSQALSQPETYCIILALKIAYQLLLKKAFPLVFLTSILHYFLIMNKFLEAPYCKYVSPILQEANRIYDENIPDDIIIDYNLIITNKVIFCKELNKVRFLLKSIPNLAKHTLYSPLFAIIHNIDLCKQNLRKGLFNFNETQNIINYALSIVSFFQFNENIITYISNFCFNFFKEGIIEIINNSHHQSGPKMYFSEKFLLNLMKQSKYLTEDFFEFIYSKAMNCDSNMNLKNIYAYFALLSVKKANTKFLTKIKYSAFINSSLKYLIDVLRAEKTNQQQKNFILKILNKYIKAIFNRNELLKTDLPKQFFEALKAFDTTIFDFETRMQLLFNYVVTTNNSPKLTNNTELNQRLNSKNLRNRINKVDQLIDFWDFLSQVENLHLKNSWQYCLVSSIEYIHPEYQLEYLNYILEKTKDDSSFLYPSILNNFLNSNQISNNVKKEFLEYLPNLIDKLDMIFVDKLYESVLHLNFETSKYQILLLFISIIKTDNSSKLTKYDKLRQLLGDNEKDRLMVLYLTLPPFLWTNKNVFYIAISIIDLNPLNYPLLNLGNYCSDFSGEFLYPILNRILSAPMSDNILNILYDILTKCISQNSDQYNQISSAIMIAFRSTNKKISISHDLIYKSIKFTNNLFLFPNTLKNSAFTIQKELLFPHKLNDYIFSTIFCSHFKDDFENHNSIAFIAATSHFFLSNYPEAYKIFNYLQSNSINDPNSTFTEVKQITANFFLKHDAFKIFELIDHKSYFLIPLLNNALSIVEHGLENENQKIELNNLFLNMQNFIVNFFKHHIHPTFYELQLISSFETILRLLKSKVSQTTENIVPKYISESCLPKILSDFLFSFTKKLFGDPNHYESLQENNDKYEQKQIIFSPEFKRCFDNFLYIDPYGFFSVSFFSISPSIIKNKDPVLWPSFLFNLFVSSDQIDENLFKESIIAHITVLDKEIIPSFMHSGLSARLLTLFGFALINLHPYQNETYQEMQNLLKEIGINLLQKLNSGLLLNYLKYWIINVIDLQNSSDDFKDATQEIQTSFSYLSFICSHFQLDDLTAHPKVMIFAKLWELCSNILQIDINHFKTNNNTKNLHDVNGSSIEDINVNELNPFELNSYKTFFNLLSELNEMMPFEYELRTAFAKVIIFKFHSSFARIGENCITFTCSTTISSHQRFVVEFTNRSELSVIFSNVLESIKNAFKYYYSSRIRLIRLSSQQVFEVGPNAIMYSVPYELVKITNQDFYDIDHTHEHQFHDIKKEMISRYDPKLFFKLRRMLISSFAAYSVTRNMFSLDQPEFILMSYSSAEFLSQASNFLIPEQFGQTASLIPDNLAEIFSKSSINNYFKSNSNDSDNDKWKKQSNIKIEKIYGELLLSISAASLALNKNIDFIRAYSEIPINDVFQFRKNNINNILSYRDKIDQSILKLSPPTSESSQPEDSFKWIKNVCQFIKNSRGIFRRIISDAIPPMETSSSPEEIDYSSSTTETSQQTEEETTTPHEDHEDHEDCEDREDQQFDFGWF